MEAHKFLSLEGLPMGRDRLAFKQIIKKWLNNLENNLELPTNHNKDVKVVAFSPKP
jgi:hypothetical protein